MMLPTPRQVARLVRAGQAVVGQAASLAVSTGVTAIRIPASAATGVPDRAVATAATVTRRGISIAETIVREAKPAARALADLRPQRTNRRVWEGNGQAHIEVRGMTGSGPKHRELRSGVLNRIRKLRGVRWAEVNAVTGQVLIAFDEGRVNVETMLDTVRSVEHAHGTRDENFPWSRPVHPSDPAPIAAAAVELAADCLSVAIAVAGRITHLPSVPRAVRVAQAVMEVERPLRRQLKKRIGPIATDAVLALSAATIHGLSKGPSAPAVDALYRMQLLAEATSRRAVWDRREDELCCTAWMLPEEAPERPTRPVPRPKGPIEKWADRLGPGALGAAGAVLALTRDPGRAADTFVVAVPKAARMGREAFAATVGRDLARRGVIPLNAAAWRRLDRVSAIVVDSTLLCSRRAQILAVEPTSDVDLPGLWRAATAALHGLSMDELAGSGPWQCQDLRLEPDPSPVEDPEPGAVRLVLRQRDIGVGRVTVGNELQPLADALLDAARSTGARVLLTRHASLAELVARVDEVLPDDQPLAAHIQRLQTDGHGVLVVSDGDDQALAVSDVGVAILGGDTCVCWSADVLCGPGLEDVWRILRATAAARRVSERAVQLAQAGSALGALVALVGGRRGRRADVLPPVYGAALVSLVQGTVAALSATSQPVPPPVAHVPWHSLDAEEVLARLDSARADTQSPPVRGWLPSAVMQVRTVGRRIPGSAQVAGVAVPTLRLAGAIRDELRDPLTPVLAVGAAASAVVGSGVDAGLVAAVMGGNALISAAQRLNAERALRRLFLEQEVAARRLQRSRDDDAIAHTVAGLDAVPLERVPANTLSAGDIIALRASDVVPADARLLSAVDVEVDESTLTGESLPCTKNADATPGAPLAERSCMVFQGTTVLAGTAYAVVVATGESTEAGRATRAAGRAAPRAGLQAQLAEVTRKALPATAIGGAAVTGLAVLRRLPLRQAIGAGVSVAVAAVPEGLPLVATVAQAAAARRLSRQAVLVRSSRTLEALGRVDVICFDKTGTLTEGRLAVARLASADADLADDDPAAQELVAAAARACPPVDAEQIRTVPHATDRAVLEAARSANHQDGWQLRSELPFETNRGYSAALGEIDGEALLVVKGAPEVVLPQCSSVAGGQHGDTGTQPMSDERREAAQRTVQRLAADGLRVLAVAERSKGLPSDLDAPDETVAELMLKGFVGVADTPRADAADAIRRIVDDGIRVMMITGDHPTTAAAMARLVGMPADTVLTGGELDQMPEDERVRRVAETSVFARVSPEQKLRIVEALQAAGLVVAMTGDGTNDAAAIRLADVGIGVAASQSSAARSAADLVLADVDIGRIYEAVLEGRALWHRVQDAVSILVGGNAGEVAFMILGTALAGRPPIGVRQMLLVNMLTDMFPALAVAVAPIRKDSEAAARPATALASILGRAVLIRGGATALAAVLAWTIGRLTGRQRRASSMGLAALVGTQLAQTLLTGWHSPLVVATALISAAVMVFVIETPGVSQFFGCTPLGPVAWAVVCGSVAAGTLAAAVAPRLIPGGAAPSDAGVAST
jgi:cation-transporting P-type ATPase I